MHYRRPVGIGWAQVRVRRGTGVEESTYLAMFLCTKMSPGFAPVTTDSGTSF